MPGSWPGWCPRLPAVKWIRKKLCLLPGAPGPTRWRRQIDLTTLGVSPPLSPMSTRRDQTIEAICTATSSLREATGCQKSRFRGCTQRIQKIFGAGWINCVRRAWNLWRFRITPMVLTGRCSSWWIGPVIQLMTTMQCNVFAMSPSLRLPKSKARQKRTPRCRQQMSGLTLS